MNSTPRSVTQSERDKNKDTLQEKKNILFVHYGDQWLRGSEVCLINLMSSLSAQFHPILWTNNQPLHKKAESLNIKSYYEPFSLLFGWNTPKFDCYSTIRLVRRTKQIIDSESIDLIHVNSAAPNQWVSIAAHAKRIPYFTQLHCHYNLRDRLSLLLHLSPKIVGVSNAVSQSLINEGFPTKQLSTIYNGIPTQNKSKLSIREKLEIKDDHPILISVGSLIHRKGFDRLINAVNVLAKKGTSTHLVIIGEGTERPQLEAQIASERLEKYVHLVGEQSKVSEWLQGGATMFVSGARSEAFGLVLVEAAMAHLPIVAPSVGGIPEVVCHNQTGLLFDNDKQLVTSIQQLLDNADFSKTLAYYAHKKALACFTLKANSNSMEHEYLELLNSKLTVHQPRHTQLLLCFSSALRPLKTFINKHIIEKHLAPSIGHRKESI
ncbi:glycosyltransferase [Vibrio maerlii]|uniref:glycosyltransferase n=1 Tax=Vibrio maerlii TaxID=2231648 RepID=UPI000E3E0C61|nr:glycosyltransferase [Vibrio maerlii]